MADEWHNNDTASQTELPKINTMTVLKNSAFSYLTIVTVVEMLNYLLLYSYFSSIETAFKAHKPSHMFCN